MYNIIQTGCCCIWHREAFSFKRELQRETDSINSGVYEEAPGVITLTPRILPIGKRQRETGIRDHSKEKEEMTCVRNKKTGAGKKTAEKLYQR